jgi:SAM-dependent methyltransferase
MKIIEYDRQVINWASTLPARKILYEDPESIPSIPSAIMLTVIREAGWSTDWAYHKENYPPKIEKTTTPNRTDFFLKLEKQLTAIDLIFKGKFNGKTFLDLGCGSKGGSEDNVKYPYRFEPWLTRVLTKLGVTVVGIDVGDLAGEPFEHHAIDLLCPNALDRFADHSFDITHSSALYSSPELGKRTSPPETKWPRESLDSAKKLLEVLLPQITRVTALDGYYLFREQIDYLRKKDIYENFTESNPLYEIPGWNSLVDLWPAIKVKF